MQRLHTLCDKAWKFEESSARPLATRSRSMHTVIIDKSASRALFQGRTQRWKDVSQFRSRSKINPRALPRTRIPRRRNPKANWSFLARPRSSKARVCKIYFIPFLQAFALHHESRIIRESDKALKLYWKIGRFNLEFDIFITRLIIAKTVRR